MERNSCARETGVIRGGVRPFVSADPRAPREGVSARTVARARGGRIVRKEGKAPKQEEERWRKVK
jgi:hypothetical protein